MQTDSSRRRPARRGVSWVRLTGAVALWSAGIGSWVALVPQVAGAATNLVAVADLNQVITNLRNVLVGLLVGLATLFATIGGVRYILAGGDPGEVEATKKTLRHAALGYGIAVLAPVLVQILRKIVGA
ncbi:hypothetical protein Arub01_57210 [Actinomadura rubrobrunea]|uniref:TrbC/VIRB2 family protein n=1 Tax=Actinomadura rubrobrunea TaxID=115335 RepID=A0A9W6Q2Z7_9ACTN|nr:hypothetical protein Arub01_57210 [Actinomadura rubrobrunea]